MTVVPLELEPYRKTDRDWFCRAGSCNVYAFHIKGGFVYACENLKLGFCMLNGFIPCGEMRGVGDRRLDFARPSDFQTLVRLIKPSDVPKPG